jgi:hypothetical protein
MQLSEIKTLGEIAKLDYETLANATHIITGPNGRCMCGVYDGRGVTCKEIWRMHFPPAATGGIEAGDGSDY